MVLAVLAVAALGAASGPLVLRTPASDTVKIEAWGSNALRVRVAVGGGPIQEQPGALIPPGSDNKGWPMAGSGSAELSRSGMGIANGNIAASVDGTTGLVTIRRRSDGTVLLREAGRGAAPPAFYPHSNLTVPAIYEAFEASDPSERVFGFGEHQRAEISLLNQVLPPLPPPRLPPVTTVGLADL